MLLVEISELGKIPQGDDESLSRDNGSSSTCNETPSDDEGRRKKQ